MVTESPHHQPLLSSLILRPSVGDGSDGAGGGGRTGGSNYEPGEVHRESPSYSRSERYSEDPVFGSNLRMTLLLYNNKISPGRGGDRPLGRGFDEPGFGPGPHRGEGMREKYPNVHQGKFCHNCKRPRYSSVTTVEGIAFSMKRKGLRDNHPLRLYLSLHFLNVAVVTGADRQLEEFLYQKSFVRICTWRVGEMFGILLGEAE
uniref:Uncharacterized protein n=1 Tax=Salix viminalis TaxID=40686 RepID=A0A6N2KKR9_SALVM